MAKHSRSPFRPGHYQTPKAPDDREETPRPHRDRYDWITLWTAVVGVIVVTVTTGINAYQAYLGHEAWRSAIYQQRAWLKITIDPQTSLEIDKKFGLFIMVKLKVTNVGAAPAEGVLSDAHPYILEIQGSKINTIPNNPNCMVMRHPKRTLDEATVFPGETVNLIPIPVAITRSDLDKLNSRSIFGFFVTACVTYRYGDTIDEHLTRSNFLVSRKKAKWPHILLDANSDTVPLKNISFEPIGAGDTAD